jgi:Mycothiol maleylpyruvate isomerase N-terminal domain
VDAITRALREQHAELDGLLTPLDGPAWDEPVPDCPGRTISDVVLHLAQTDDLVGASAEQGFAEAARLMVGDGAPPGATVDAQVGLLVDLQRGAPGPRLAWRRLPDALARDPSRSALIAAGPDAGSVLAHVRTYA